MLGYLTSKIGHAACRLMSYNKLVLIVKWFCA